MRHIAAVGQGTWNALWQLHHSQAWDLGPTRTVLYVVVVVVGDSRPATVHVFGPGSGTSRLLTWVVTVLKSLKKMRGGGPCGPVACGREL